MKITATLDRVMHDKPKDNGEQWIVGKFRGTNGSRFVATGVVGKEVDEGLQLEIEGDWETRKYGRQFKFRHYSICRPIGREAITKFLATAPTIGPVRAGMLYDDFGEDAIEVVANQPDRVNPIRYGKGLKLDAASNDLRFRLNVVNLEAPLVAMFSGLGFPRTLARTLIDEGVNDPVGAVSKNPFILRKYSGCSYLRCDRLRDRLGLSKNMPERRVAAVEHAINQEGDSVWIHKNLVIKLTADALEVTTQEAVGILRGMLDKGHIVHRDNYIALAGSAEDEKFITDWIIERQEIGSGTPWPASLPGLSDHQRGQAVKAFQNGPTAFLLGSAGTGKSFSAARIMKQFDGNVVACAPFGKAAARLKQYLQAPEVGLRDVPVSTVHRLLEPTPSRGGWTFTKNEDNPIEADLIVLDELSTLPNSLAASFFRAIAPETNLLMLGDWCQLPSVGRGTLIRDWLHWVINNPDSGCTAGILSHVHRNAGEIIRVATALRDGEMVDLIQVEKPPSKWGADNNLLHILSAGPAYTLDGLLNYARRIADGQIRFPDGRVAGPQDLQVLCATNQGSPISRVELNEVLRPILNPKANRSEPGWHAIYKPGDRVINNRNRLLPSSGGRTLVSNGDIGYVRESHEKHVVVKFEACDEEVVVPCGTREADELSFAYAITVHKAIGSQAPIVATVVSTAHRDQMVMSRESLYTAITRASELSLLFGPGAGIIEAAKKIVSYRRKSFMHQNLIGRTLRCLEKKT